MKITRYREHKINTGDYESVLIGSRYEFNTEVDDYPDGYDEDSISGYLLDLVDDDLAEEAQRLLESDLPVAESHLRSYYETD